jgi:transcriptional regulator with XRE-family HTH domain
MRELGKKAGLNPVTIGRLEKGRQPARLDTVRKLARGLEVEPIDLLVRK